MTKSFHRLLAPEGEFNVEGTATAPTAQTIAETTGDVERVLEALRKERQRAKQAEAERAALATQLQELQNGGRVDPKAFEEAQRRAELAERERKAAEERLEQVRRETEGKFSGTVEDLTKQLQAERQEKQRQAVKFAARDAFLAADGRTDAGSDGVTAFDYFWSQFGTRFGSDEKGLYVADADGDPMLDSETGKRLDPNKWLSTLRDDPLHGMHFKGQYGSGGGSRSNRDGRAIPGVDIASLSTDAKFKAAFGRAKR